MTGPLKINLATSATGTLTVTHPSSAVALLGRTNSATSARGTVVMTRGVSGRVNVATSATGSLETGAFTPAVISGLQLWHDASVPSSITESGGLVSQWNDLSGNARHYTGTTTQRPTTGTRTQNSLNVLDFDGVLNGLSTTSFSYTYPWTTFLVLKSDDGADGTTQAILNTAGDAAATMRLSKLNSNLWRFSNGTNIDTGAAPTTNAYVFSVIYNDTASELYLNGTLNSSGTTGTSTATTGRRVGISSTGLNPWDGWIAEIVEYNTALSTTDRDRVESYLGTKWGITVA